MNATLLLRPPSPRDAAPLHAVLGDPAVCRFLPALPSPTLAATRHYLGLCGLLAESGDVATVVLADAAAPDNPFGLVQTGWHEGAVEVGMLLGRAQWGRGLMARALDRVLAAPVAAWGEGTHATAACDAANEAARRMLVRAGFTEAEPLPAFRVHPALGPAPRDCVLFRRPLGSLY